MQKGYAPIGADGYRIEVHHLLGKEPGPVVEIERTLHQKETKILHHMIEDSFRKNKGKRKKEKGKRKKEIMESFQSKLLETKS